MKLVKIIPPWLCQTIFVDDEGELKNMDSKDLDIFYLLIFMTSKNYHQTKFLKHFYPFKELQEHLTEEMSTTNLVKKLKKLDNLTIHSNLLQSYDDKKIKTFIPFQIQITKDVNNKNNGFEVTVDAEFIQSFENPNPIFVLSYDYFTKLTSTDSKLLYLLLGDALGTYKTKTRNIELDFLKTILNRDIQYDKYEFVKDLKKAQIQISQTDIAITFTPQESYVKDNNKRMNKIVTGYSFEIERVKNKPRYKKDTKQDEVFKNDDTETAQEQVVVEVVEAASFSIDNIIESIIDYEVEGYEKSSNQKINNMGGFRANIKKDYSDKEQRAYIKKVHMWLEENKKELESTNNIDPSQGNVLSIFDEVTYNAYTINYKYLLCNHKGKEIKKTHKETYIFLTTLGSNHKIHITNNQETFCKVARLSTGRFFS